MLRREDALRERRMDGVSWRVLAGTEGATDPFWSDDSTSLGYFSGGRLYTISLDGSNRRDLAPVVNPRGATWKGARGTDHHICECGKAAAI